MEDQNVNRIKKANNIARNIADISKNYDNITGSDALYEFVDSDSEKANKLLERFESEDSTRFKTEQIARIDKNKSDDVSKLINRLKNLNSIRIKKIRNRINISVISAISAAIIVFSLIILKKDPSVPVADTIEDIIVPTLITNLGEKINLDKIDVKTGDYNVEIVDENTLICKSDEKEITYNKLQIPSKYTYKLTLTDGTEATLNAGSSIKYPTRFDQERKVEMTGEVYFKVAKSDIPFIVKVNDIEIKVYGTEFNINVISDEKIETVLITGEIGVNTPQMKEVIMAPSQLFSYNKSITECELTDVNVQDYIKWKENAFSYVKRPLTTVLNDMQRWYNVNFNIKCDISDSDITLFMSRELDISDALNLIELLVDVKFIKEGGSSYSIIK